MGDVILCDPRPPTKRNATIAKNGLCAEVKRVTVVPLASGKHFGAFFPPHKAKRQKVEF